MILAGLKKQILIRKIQKSNKKKDFNSRSEIAGLMIDKNNLQENLKLLDFYKSIGFKKENFRIVYCGTQEELPENMDVIILDPKAIGFNGKFKSEEIQGFQSESFDFLICSFSESCWPAALLVSSCKSRLKLGARPDAFGIFDVMIDTNDAEVFQQECLKYLKILK